MSIEARRRACSNTLLGHEGPVTAPGWYPDPEGRPSRRYFDGRRWTEQWEMLDDRRRREILQDVLVEYTHSNSRVVAQSSTSATLVMGSSAGSGANVVHALLSIFTCGLWLLVWLLIRILDQSGGEQTHRVYVDPYGSVVWTRPGVVPNRSDHEH